MIPDPKYKTGDIVTILCKDFPGGAVADWKVLRVWWQFRNNTWRYCCMHPTYRYGNSKLLWRKSFDEEQLLCRKK